MASCFLSGLGLDLGDASQRRSPRTAVRLCFERRGLLVFHCALPKLHAQPRASSRGVERSAPAPGAWSRAGSTGCERPDTGQYRVLSRLDEIVRGVSPPRRRRVFQRLAGCLLAISSTAPLSRKGGMPISLVLSSSGVGSSDRISLSILAARWRTIC